jgi:hypothetical protein
MIFKICHNRERNPLGFVQWLLHSIFRPVDRVPLSVGNPLTHAEQFARLPTRMTPKYRAWLATIVVLYLLFAASSSVAKGPRPDEGVFASPAYNMLTKGHMGTTVIETLGTDLDGLKSHTYWVMPLNLVIQIGWYKLFGFGLLSMRLLSVTWGLVALLSWFAIVENVTGDCGLAVLATALIAVNYDFIMIASDGRMDAMCAALCFAGFASYLSRRQYNLSGAILISNALVAAALFTHPNGLLGVLGLTFLIWYFDRQRFEVRQIGFAAAPYLAYAAGWGLYILQDPHLFFRQFLANAQDMGRLNMLTSPWAGFKAEVGQRYLGHFAGLSPSVPKLMRVKVLIVLVYVAAVIGSLSVRAIRQHRGRRALLVLMAIYFSVLTLLDGQKQYIYVVHIVPLYAVITAVWIHWHWSKEPALRKVIVLGIGALLLLHSTGVLYRVVQANNLRDYSSVVHYLSPHMRQETLVMGSAELGFGVGFDHVLDDPKLGFVTHRKPDFIVVEPHYEAYFRNFVRTPQIHEFVMNRLDTEYQLTYQGNWYRVYAVAAQDFTERDHRSRSHNTFDATLAGRPNPLP